MAKFAAMAAGENELAKERKCSNLSAAAMAYQAKNNGAIWRIGGSRNMRQHQRNRQRRAAWQWRWHQWHQWRRRKYQRIKESEKSCGEIMLINAQLKSENAINGANESKCGSGMPWRHRSVASGGNRPGKAAKKCMSRAVWYQ
jgi:hypothetical protein